MLLHQLEIEQFLRVFKHATEREKIILDKLSDLYDTCLDLEADLERARDVLEYLDDKNIALEKEITRLNNKEIVK